MISKMLPAYLLGGVGFQVKRRESIYIYIYICMYVYSHWPPTVLVLVLFLYNFLLLSSSFTFSLFIEEKLEFGAEGRTQRLEGAFG